MKQKFFTISSICILLLLGGLGCKGLSSEEQAAIQPVTLEYWTVFNDVGVLREFATAYQQIRPYVTVRIRQVRPTEFDELFVNALADDVQPDIVSIHNQSLRKYVNRLSPMPNSVRVATVEVRGQYAKETVVTPIETRMPSVNGIRSRYVKAVADDTIISGRRYGLPLSVDTLAIYYNKDLLDRAGIALPPATWDEFLNAVIETTTFNTIGDIIQSGVALGTADNISRSFDIMSLLLLQNGVSLGGSSGVSFSGNLEALGYEHPTLQALKFYTDFSRPTVETYTWNDKQDDALDAFVRGKSVFYFGFAYERREIERRAPQMNVDIIPVPQIDPQVPKNVASYWIESVVRKSPDQDEAWDFIQFMSSPENIARYTEEVEQASPLRSQIEAQKENPKIAPFAQEVLHAYNWYRGENVAVAKSAFDNLIIGYNLPYGDGVDTFERDANLVINAARVVQQTF